MTGVNIVFIRKSAIAIFCIALTNTSFSSPVGRKMIKDEKPEDKLLECIKDQILGKR